MPLARWCQPSLIINFFLKQSVLKKGFKLIKLTDNKLKVTALIIESAPREWSASLLSLNKVMGMGCK